MGANTPKDQKGIAKVSDLDSVIVWDQDYSSNTYWVEGLSVSVRGLSMRMEGLSVRVRGLSVRVKGLV